MSKDLSKDKYSVTSIYIDLLPTIESIKADSSLDMEDKLDKAREVVLNAICKNSGETRHVGTDYIVKARQAVYSARTIDQIITYMKAAINKGKNYDDKKMVVTAVVIKFSNNTYYAGVSKDPAKSLLGAQLYKSRKTAESTINNSVNFARYSNDKYEIIDVELKEK